MGRGGSVLVTSHLLIIGSAGDSGVAGTCHLSSITKGGLRGVCGPVIGSGHLFSTTMEGTCVKLKC